MNAMLMIAIFAAAVVGTCKSNLSIIHKFLKFIIPIKHALSYILTLNVLSWLPFGQFNPTHTFRECFQHEANNCVIYKMSTLCFEHTFLFTIILNHCIL